MSDAYTPQELMIAVAAREIRDRELVFVGTRLPIIAYAVARNTHAPNARGLFEVGLMRDQPATSYLGTMGDPPNVAGALWATRMSNVMALMAQGMVDLGFIGGAEVDRFGNLNTSYVGPPERPRVKLPGSGGGADIAILSRRWVTLMTHERRRLVTVTVPVIGAGATGCSEAGRRPSSRPCVSSAFRLKAARLTSIPCIPGVRWRRCARRPVGTSASARRSARRRRPPSPSCARFASGRRSVRDDHRRSRHHLQPRRGGRPHLHPRCIRLRFCRRRQELIFALPPSEVAV